MDVMTVKDEEKKKKPKKRSGMSVDEGIKRRVRKGLDDDEEEE